MAGHSTLVVTFFLSCLWQEKKSKSYKILFLLTATCSKIQNKLNIMFYTYYLCSINSSEKTYIGFTKNLKDRLAPHNAGRSVYTSDDRPWRLEAFFVFDTEAKARRFEVYLKTNAGKIFLKRYVIAE